MVAPEPGSTGVDSWLVLQRAPAGTERRGSPRRPLSGSRTFFPKASAYLGVPCINMKCDFLSVQNLLNHRLEVLLKDILPGDGNRRCQ